MSAANTLAPELRFKEFRDGSPWQLVALGSHAEIIKQRAGKKKYPVMSVETGVGLVSQQEKFGRDISGNSYKNYTVIQRDDFAYNKSATNDFPQGFIAKHKHDNKAAVPNSIFTCFRLTSCEIQSEYLYFQLLNNLHGKWLRKFITVGARAHGALSVNTNDLLNLPVPLPTGKSSKAEQQKIADCLTSLDELIAAHRRKLDALKDHKKGLVHQLFPAEGETTPKLRFPEFKNADDWKEVKLGTISTITIGEFVIKSKQNSIAPYPVYNGGRSPTGFYEHYNNEGNAIIISARGANAGFVNIVKHRYWAGNSCYTLRLHNKNHSLDFVYWNVKKNQKTFTDNQHAANIPSVNKSNVEEFTIKLTSPAEQKKIADCLSDLDSLLAVQAEQIAALRAHKMGLMQKLFPNSEICQP